MLRGVQLPAQLQQAIEAKLQSEQESQKMEFVLLKGESAGAFEGREGFGCCC